MESTQTRYYTITVGLLGNVFDDLELFTEAFLSCPGSTARWFNSRHEADAWLKACRPVPNRSAVAGKQTFPIPAQNVVPPLLQPPPPISQTAEPAPPIELSREQKLVLEMVKAGQNVFFTGPAGTGKSVLLREIVKVLRSTQSPEAVAITAPTGIAGINIGGCTFHSFAGIGLGNEDAKIMAERISRSQKLKDRWVQTNTLIIDEISMFDGILFDKVEFVARYVRKSNRPFGGIQLILSGDFFQLPPVPGRSHEYKMDSSFAFEAQSWNECVGRPVVLSRVFRQTDSEFIDILSAMRIGKLTEAHVSCLRQLSRRVHYPDGIEPSYLFPLRMEVQAFNNHRLQSINAPAITYNAMDKAGCDPRGNPIHREQALKLLSQLIALPELTLKVGAQVMLIQNIVQGSMVNGSCGKVIDFLTHKEALEKHIAITELSKGAKRNLPINDQVPPTSLHPITNSQFQKNDKWPLVQFTNGGVLLCAPVEFTVEGFIGNIEAQRVQVPLILSWALSIHKSQGQTLERVKVDLNKIFENGQAYVAISRATKLEQLEIVNFSASRIRVHERVKKWQQYIDSTCTREETSSDMEMDSEEAISHYWS